MDVDALVHVEAEQAVLGCLFLDLTAWDAVAGMVSEHDFYIREHRMTWRAIARLMERGAVVDVITVAEALDGVGQLDQVGGLQWLTMIASAVPSAARVAHYGQIVREYSIFRSMATASREIYESIMRREGRGAREVLDAAQARLSAIGETASRGRAEFIRVSDIVGGTIARIDDLHSRPTRTDVTGLATGFADLDRQTTGLHPGDLVILAARPSMGKTALSLNMAEAAGLAGKKVAFFSLEMINDQLMVRLLSSVARLNQHRVKIGRLNDDEWRRLMDGMGKVQDMPIWLCEQSNLSITEVKALARRMHREAGGLDLIVIDYLQLMRGGEKRSDSRAQEVEEISRGLKGLAKELHLPIIALSQLNRGLEQRQNKRPIMSDLRDSGSIEQDADLIWFIYRDEVYNEDTPDRGVAELLVAKQRNGPIGTVYLSFVHEQTRFESRPQTGIPSQQIRAEKRSRQATANPRTAPAGRTGYSYAERDEIPI